MKVIGSTLILITLGFDGVNVPWATDSSTAMREGDARPPR